MKVLITGATRGMGFEVSKILAPECDILLGTSKNRPIDDPNLIELSKIANKFEYFPQDLNLGRKAAIAISSWVRKHVQELDLLVLNCVFWSHFTGNSDFTLPPILILFYRGFWRILPPRFAV